jgi:hypothetical protein
MGRHQLIERRTSPMRRQYFTNERMCFMPAISRALRRGRIRYVLVTFALFLALLTRPVAADNQGGLDRGYGVDAFWYYVDGCIETQVFVFAAAFTSVGAQLVQRDICAEPAALLLDANTGQGQIQPDEALQVNPGLSKAELHATVTVYDSVSGTSFPLFIDLVYERVGGMGDCSSDEGPVPPPEGVKSVACSAVANGTVSDGTKNYTPIPGNAVLELHRGFTG